MAFDTILQTYGPWGYTLFVAGLVIYLWFKQRGADNDARNARREMIGQIQGLREKHEQEMNTAVFNAQQENQRRQNDLEDRLIKSAEQRESILQKRVETLEHNVRELTDKLSASEEDVQSLEIRLRKESEDNQALRDDKNAAEHRADELSEKLAKVAADLDIEKKQRQEYEKTITSMNMQIQALRKRVDDLSGQTETFVYEDGNG